ncbi:MAG: hypothetical protein RR394_06695 [Oscillospiraceae bacterium]
MKIIELELTNFKGIRSALLDFDGKNARIIGQNATGKTTAMDAFIWLLTGKDHLGRSDLNFSIKTLDADGAVIPMLDHMVRGKLWHDGSTFELVRNFHEVWQKKTGTNVRTFSGHKTEYAIDNVPKTEKEYSAFVEKIAPAQLVYLLTMTGYFNEQIKADERRKMLLEMCGDVDESGLLALPEFAELSSFITSTVAVSDLKKAKAAQKTKINEEIKSIPTAINVHAQYMETSGLDRQTEQKAVEWLSKEIEEATAQSIALDNGESLSRLRCELADLEAEHIRLDSRNDAAREAATAGLRNDLKEAQSRAFEIAQAISESNRRLSALNADINVFEKERKSRLEQYHRLSERTYSGDAVCPACGQALPAEKVQAAVEQFNESKAKELEEIVAEGRLLATKISKAQETISRYEAALSDTEKDKDKLNIEIEHLNARLENAALASDVNSSDTFAIDSKKAEIERLTHSSDGEKAELDAKILRLKEAKAVREGNLSKIKNAANAALEIDRLKAKEKELAAAFEECEKLISLCDNFGSAKVKMLDERISGAFRFAKFKLTETLVNGGVKEVCETLVDGVPYSAANNAARINVGLDIVETFSARYGVRLPIFVDNAESVCELYRMDLTPERSQIIQLVVPAPFESLPTDFQEFLIDRCGSEEAAKNEYDEPNRQLRLEREI